MEELVLQLIKSIGKCGFAIANDSIKQTTRQSKHYKFRGVLDFWYNGINNSNISLGDYVSFTCQISPLLQLFPNNPFRNARRWNKLYTNDISNEIKNAVKHTYLILNVDPFDPHTNPYCESQLCSFRFSTRSF